MVKKEGKKVHRPLRLGFFELLVTIIRKNIKLIIRSRSSSLIVLLGPLLIIALVGTAYNTSNIYDIRVGAYSESYSELAESILDELGSKQFTVVRLESVEECTSSLKSAEIHVCAIIPPNLETGSSESMEFLVDQSRVNLVWIIIDAVSSKVSSKTTELSLQMTNSILNALTNSLEKIKLNEEKIGEAESANTDVEGSVQEATSALSEINFDLVGEVDLGKISQKLDDIIEANNLSSSTFDPVKTVISKIKNNTESVGESLEESVMGSLEKLGEASSNLETSSASISDVASTIEDIKGEIELATGRSAESIVTPIKTKITPVVAEKTHLSFLFPTLIVLVVMLMALILSSSLVVKEKRSPALFRNYISPVRDTIFLLGHFLTSFIILILQLVVVFGVAVIFFKGALISVLWKVVIVLLPIVAVFILIGMFLGYVFRTPETSMLATISVASLFLFFSSTILPLETLPQSLKKIADFNPFVLSESMLKKIMLFKVELGSVSEPILALLTYCLLFAVLVYFVQKYSKLRA
ncbi:MAG: ABC transporter permease [Candidatus Woesearchaeota archaeon]